MKAKRETVRRLKPYRGNVSIVRCELDPSEQTILSQRDRDRKWEMFCLACEAVGAALKGTGITSITIEPVRARARRAK